MNTVILIGSDCLAILAAKLLSRLPVKLLHFQKNSDQLESHSVHLERAFMQRWPQFCQSVPAPLPYEAITCLIDQRRGVELRLRSNGLGQRISGDYLIAADGIDSEIRQLLGIKMISHGPDSVKLSPYSAEDFAFGRVRLIGSAAHQFFNDQDLNLWLDDLAAVDAELSACLAGKQPKAADFHQQLEAQDLKYQLASAPGQNLLKADYP